MNLYCLQLMCELFCTNRHEDRKDQNHSESSRTKYLEIKNIGWEEVEEMFKGRAHSSQSLKGNYTRVQ